MFVAGVLSATIALVALIWFGRVHAMNLLSIGYRYEHRPVVLAKDFQILQNGRAVGVLRSGAQVQFVGADKTSPIETYAITFGWENRGADRDKLFKDAGAGEALFGEIRPD
jgi:hypothetical protein